MKVKMLVDVTGPEPGYSLRDMLNAQSEGKPYHLKSKMLIQKGAIIEHPDCWWLVKFGSAEPADDECRVVSEAWGWNDKVAALLLAEYRKTAAAQMTGMKKYDAEKVVA